MTLRQLIDYLENENPNQVVPVGFGGAHSYRGYYEELAFEPEANVSVGEMLRVAKTALGATFEGYKGGLFVMGSFTPVWLAYYGSEGEGIGPVLLSYMLKKPTLPLP